MPTLTSVTKHFITSQEGFTTTTAGSVASGAATVTLNSVSGYTNGDQVAFVIDPTDVTKKQVFTGTIDTSGVQVTNVVWTEGTNQTHAAGATVVDYTTATHQAAMVKGVKISLDDDGTLKAGAVDNAAVLASGVVETAKIADEAVTFEKTTGIWWEELGRTTLGSTAASITVSGLTAKAYLKILVFAPISSTSTRMALRFNGDTGSNYSISTSENFGAVATAVSQTSINLAPTSGNSSPYGVEITVFNNQTSAEKNVIAHLTHRGVSGAGTAPTHRVTFGKWANTSAQITEVNIINPGSGDFNPGAEVVVLGHN